MLSTFMEVLDTTVVNVSLPHIAGSLSATVDEATWTLTSYLVANAIILPLTGWLSNYLRPQTHAHAFGHRLHDRFLRVWTCSDAFHSSSSAASFKARAAAAFNRSRKPCCSNPSRHRIAAKPWDSGDSASSSHRFSAPSSAAGSPTVIVGAGFSTSTSHRSRVDHHDAHVRLRSGLHQARIIENRLLGHRHVGGRHRLAASRPRQRPGKRLVRHHVDHRRCRRLRGCARRLRISRTHHRPPRRRSSASSKIAPTPPVSSSCRCSASASTARPS